MISSEKRKWKGYKNILLPLGHNADVNNLTKLVSFLINKKEGFVELNHVIEEGSYSKLPGEWREGAKRVTESHHMMMRFGIHSERKVITAENVKRGILEEALEMESDLIILGWGPKPKSKISGMISKIMDKSHCDVIVYKSKNNLDSINKIIYPIAVEPDISRLNLISRISRENDATLTLAHFVDKNNNERHAEKLLENALAKANSFDMDVKKLILKGSSLEKSIGEASEDFDLMVLGPSGDWWVYQTLFGKKTDKIASNANCSVLLHKYKAEYND